MKIVAFYSDKESGRTDSSLAANSKIDYIASRIKNCGYDVELLSLCVECNKKNIKKETKATKDGIPVHYINAFPRKTFIQKVFHKLFDSLRVLFFLKNRLQKNETIILYHSTRYLRAISFLHRRMNINLILEVEEVYGDVTFDVKKTKKEYKFFANACAYIFPTELLNERINKNGKPYLIVHGNYSNTPFFKECFNDNKVHCIYAGTFDSNKGGAQFCVTACRYLSSNYHLHIIGFGTKKDTDDIKKLIEQVSSLSKCTVSFDGLLSGEEYLRFIQKCQVGISCQNPDGLFNDTSFPSKVISYLANGLRVVSIRIPVLEQSFVSESIIFYDEHKPEELANAIMSLPVNSHYNGRDLIKRLDENFKKSICNLLNLFDIK